MKIKEYTSDYQDQLFELFKKEGEEWGYWLPENQANYVEALEKSVTYIVVENDQIIGFVRTLNDFVIWIVDLLVHKEHRGRAIGKQLMTYVCEQFPNKEVYVSGANDALPYYKKLGYEPEGVVYQVKA
ncbi:GNAT family N-acetyltransferase [Candidatus Enterococcus mangumiae]|uniref:N-acetyltransferase domain-containing protein n=1 Tax=Candidatus Enterococcus mangumiae TaxID=2230878 RepID=A0ABZ2T3J3_9ENTE|nr:GNAT family N-acetyltransferase [Enterococcus sp. DIV1094]MBO0491281.1 GNAT family N-acetyltransferase [Enterococcus sp. DIV1094]